MSKYINILYFTDKCKCKYKILVKIKYLVIVRYNEFSLFCVVYDDM
jgi:hypothetical protein